MEAKLPPTDDRCTNQAVLAKFGELYREAFEHDGFAELKVEIRLLRHRQKEVILHCGKQYRFVVDWGAQGI